MSVNTHYDDFVATNNTRSAAQTECENVLLKPFLNCWLCVILGFSPHNMCDKLNPKFDIYNRLTAVQKNQEVKGIIYEVVFMHR